MMSLKDFLDRIVDDGIIAATKDYAASPHKREGAIDGFTSCRDKTPEEIKELLRLARKETADARLSNASSETYWKQVCKEREIEWVANCLSCAMVNQGLPTIVPPTARGMQKAAEVLGVASTQSGATGPSV